MLREYTEHREVYGERAIRKQQTINIPQPSEPFAPLSSCLQLSLACVSKGLVYTKGSLFKKMAFFLLVSECEVMVKLGD